MRWELCLFVLPVLLAQEPESMVQRGSRLFRQATELIETGRYQEALPFAEQALAIHRDMRSAESRFIMAELQNLGLIARKLGNHEKSLAYLQESLQLAREAGLQHQIALCLIELSNTLRTMKRYLEADPLVREAIEIARTLPDTDQRIYATACNTYGALHLSLQDNEGANRWFNRALIAMRRSPDSTPDVEASLLANLAATSYGMGRNDEALALFREAIQLMETKLGAQHPKLAETLSSYAFVLKQMKRKDEANDASRRADTIRNSFLPQR
jgi:tetratricopeptide (TPR) repeat protein